MLFFIHFIISYLSVLITYFFTFRTTAGTNTPITITSTNVIPDLFSGAMHFSNILFIITAFMIPVSKKNEIHLYFLKTKK